MTVRALAVGNNNTDQVDHRSLIQALVETDGNVNSRAGVFPSSPGPASLSNVSAMVAGVGPFKAVIPNQFGNGMYLVQSDSTVNITFDAGEASVIRNDRIIVRVYNADQDSNTAGPGGTPMYDAVVEYLKGQVSGPANPVPQGALLLWEVPVPAGASAGGGGINFTSIASDKRVYTSAASGFVMVATSSELATITNPYHGMVAYVRDINTIFSYDGTAWRVRGQSNVSSSSALSNILNPYDGLIVVARDTNIAYQYDGTAWFAMSPYRASQTVSVATPTITFNNIPSSLRVLRISWTARSTDTGFQTRHLRMRVNNVSSTGSYRSQFLEATGSADATTGTSGFIKAVGSNGTDGFSYVGLTSTGLSGAGIFGSGTLEIVNWNNPHAGYLGIHWTAFNPDSNGTGVNSKWYNTGASVYAGNGPYTRLDFFSEQGNWDVGTQFFLQGWE